MSRYFINDTYYFITCPTVNHERFYYSDRKNVILTNLLKASEKFDVKNLDYGINSDHYHLLGYFYNGKIIPNFLKLINGVSSLEINKMDKIKGRKIWDEYYIYYVDKEETLFKIKGYVIGNPYKHGEVNSLDKLKNYKYSSFQDCLKEFSVEEVEDIVLSTIKMNEKDFLKELNKGDAIKMARNF